MRNAKSVVAGAAVLLLVSAPSARGEETTVTLPLPEAECSRIQEAKPDAPCLQQVTVSPPTFRNKATGARFTPLIGPTLLYLETMCDLQERCARTAGNSTTGTCVGGSCLQAYYPGPNWPCGTEWDTASPAWIRRHDATGGSFWKVESHFWTSGKLCFDVQIYSTTCDQRGIGYSVSVRACGTLATTPGLRKQSRSDWDVSFLFAGFPMSNAVHVKMLINPMGDHWLFFGN